MEKESFTKIEKTNREKMLVKELSDRIKEGNVFEFFEDLEKFELSNAEYELLIP